MYKIFIDGTEYHSNLAKKLLSTYNDLTIVEDEDEAEYFYHIFGTGIELKNIRYWLSSKKKHLIHWIGSDTDFYVKKSGSFKDNIKKYIRKSILKRLFKNNRVKYLASAPWIGDIVTSKSNYSCKFVLISTIEKNKFQFTNIEKDIDFMSYLPLGSEDLYSYYEILELAKNLPEKKFLIVVPNINKEDEFLHECTDNIKIVGKQTFDQMLILYERTKCFLRLKKSGDAYALTVLEALYFNSNVLWLMKDDNVPNLYHLPDINELIPYVTTNLEKLLSKPIDNNAKNYIDNNLSLDSWHSELINALNELK